MPTYFRRRLRAGFTMVELLVAMAIFGVIGVALVKMLLTQSTGFKRDVSSRRARAGSRGSMNMMISDIRMAQDTLGLDVANDSTITIKAPVMFGLVCEANATATTIAAIRADSFAVADAKYGGYAVRNPNSPYNYTFVTRSSSNTMSTGTASKCTGLANPVRADTIKFGGTAGSIYQFTPGTTATTAAGQPAFLWQYITYRFRSSGAGRSLYRVACGADTISTGSQCNNEKIMGPFGTGARFNYFVTTSTAASQDTSVKTAPSNLSTIRGVEVVLAAISPDTVGSSRGPSSATTTTAVFFKNMRNP
jgi:prepilin-type N-terminal cleavage/methylation domain-containing protein